MYKLTEKQSRGKMSNLGQLKRISKILFSLKMISIILFAVKKGVYPYEYMNDWKEFTKTSLPEEFCSNLNMKDIIDADYVFAKRVCQDFEIKNLSKCHNF